MLISLIWAMDNNQLIGNNNRLPWRLPADMRWFRRHTLGKPVVMGRKTFESFGAKPLPERTNIVVTRESGYSTGDGSVLVANSVTEALDAVSTTAELMVIGGASLYEQLLPQADRLYVTRVMGEFSGDAWFPAVEWERWQEVEHHHHMSDDRNPHDCFFTIYRPLQTIDLSGDGNIGTYA